MGHTGKSCRGQGSMRECGHQPRHPAATFRVGGGGGGRVLPFYRRGAGDAHARRAREARSPALAGAGAVALGARGGQDGGPMRAALPPVRPARALQWACTARHSTVRGRRCGGSPWMERRAGRALRGGGAESATAALMPGCLSFSGRPVRATRGSAGPTRALTRRSGHGHAPASGHTPVRSPAGFRAQTPARI